MLQWALRELCGGSGAQETVKVKVRQLEGELKLERKVRR